MMDSMSPFLFSGSNKARANPFAFHMLDKGGRLFDSVSGIQAACVADGIRYGIVDGVVTQFAVNQAPIEDKGLRGCPAFTQLAKYTEDLTNAAWSKSNILTPVLAGTFQGQNIWNCTENTVYNVYHTLSQNQFVGVVDNSVIGYCFVAKPNGRKIYINVKLKNNTYTGTRINLSTMSVEEVGGAIAHSVKDLGDGYCRVFVAYNVGAGTYDPNIYVQFHNGTSNQYIGDGVSGIYIGQPTFINFGVNGVPFIPPYVPNNSSGSVSVVSEAATYTTGTRFDLDAAILSRLKTGLRGPNAQGHIELEVESNVDSGWLASAHYSFMSVRDNVLSLLYLTKEADLSLSIKAYDGTNVAMVKPSNISVGQTFRISLDYGTYTDGTQKMRLTVNGVRSSVAAFSGSFGARDLKFFFGNTVHAGWIKPGSLKFIPKPIWVY